MKRMIAELFLIVFLLAVLACMGHAQTATPVPPTQPINLSATPAPVWFNASPESSTVRLILNPGTVFRFGDTTNSKWSDATIVNGTSITPTPGGSGGVSSSPLQLIPYYANLPFADPDPGTVKELDILETAQVQTINAVDAMGQTFTITVPALPLPPPPPVNPLGLLVGTCYVSKSGAGNFVMTCTPVAP